MRSVRDKSRMSPACCTGPMPLIRPCRPCQLMLRSSKGVHKAPAVGPWLGLGPSPDPGLGAGVELGGGDLGGVGDLIGVREGLPGQRLAAEDPPPAFLQVQPAGAFGDESMTDAGVVFEPGPGALAVVAGEVIGDDV